MKKYFYTDGKQNFGPFTIEELKTKNITPQTRVWYQGMSDWTPAGELPELQVLFTGASQVPPPPTQNSNVSSQPTNTFVSNNYAPQGTPPKSYLVESILVTLFCCMPFGIVGIINAANVESRFKAGDYAGALEASQKAKKWVRWALFAGIFVVILYFGYIAFIIGMSEYGL